VVGGSGNIAAIAAGLASPRLDKEAEKNRESRGSWPGSGNAAQRGQRTKGIGAGEIAAWRSVNQRQDDLCVLIDEKSRGHRGGRRGPAKTVMPSDDTSGVMQ
jgi:hypothetical protein